MRIAIFGCRDGKYVYEQIMQKGHDKYQVCCFCDNDSKYHNTTIAEMPVLDSVSMVEKYKSKEIEAVIIAVRKGYSRYCIIEQLTEAGIDNIILIKPSLLTYKLPIVFDEKSQKYYRHWMILNHQEKIVIQHLEAHVADGCNLKCRGCLHFSNLFGREEFPDLSKLLKDMQRISEKCEIFQFRVLGGEPLLNRDLPTFLKILREILPNTDIAVISNGILIPQASEELFKVMMELDIGFNLTLYPPTLKMKEKIYEVLDKHHVAYGSHEAKINEFEKYLMLQPAEHDTRAYEQCVSRGILTLRDGKLYKCPIVTFVNRYFDTFSIPQHYNEGIDIYDDNLDWNEIIERLTFKEGSFCRHCSIHSEQFDWCIGRPEYTDWLIK